MTAKRRARKPPPAPAPEPDDDDAPKVRERVVVFKTTRTKTFSVADGYKTAKDVEQRARDQVLFDDEMPLDRDEITSTSVHGSTTSASGTSMVATATTAGTSSALSVKAPSTTTSTALSVTSMPTEREEDLAAVGIYGVMAHDPSDAIDMINECESVRTLELLHGMLTTPGSAKTDHELNALMAGPVKRRLDALKGTTDG